MPSITFFVESKPEPQPRHKASSIGGKARMYLPKYKKERDPETGERVPLPIRQFKADIIAAVRRAYGGPVMEGPVTLYCTILMPRNKGMIWKKKPMLREPHTVKPDTDNIVKGIKDAITNSGIVWKDDSQVWREGASKLYASGEEAPGVSITIIGEE